MKFCIKSSHCPNLAEAIKLIRPYTGENISTIKDQLIERLPLACYDMHGNQERENFLQLIADLESSGCTLMFFEADPDEIQIDKRILLQYFDLEDEITDQIDRENELTGTEIIVAADPGSQVEGEILYEDHGKIYYRFAYSAELLNLIRQNKNQGSVTYYQRNLNDSNQQNWDETSTTEILELMGM